MCAVSNIGDYWRDTLPRKDYWPAIEPIIYPHLPLPSNPPESIIIRSDEFDALKRDVEELKLLLKAAKRFDEATGQPDCELESKIDLIKRLAAVVGVDLSEVFGK